MATIILGCDVNDGNDSLWQNTIHNMLTRAGHNVKDLEIHPTPFGVYSYSGEARGKIGVYIMADSLVSVADLAYGGTSFDYTYFVIRGDLGRPRMSTLNHFETSPIGRDPDCTSICDKLAGLSYAQMNDRIKDRCLCVFGENPEAGGNRLLQAMGNPQMAGSGSGGSGGNYNGSLQGNSDSNISPLLQGEMTFQELVGEICNGIDLMFLCKRSTVVVTDFSAIFAEAQYLRDNHYKSVRDEDINLWQLEEDSYELNINQHGYYNTVYVHYKNGVVKESFEDLVRTFGELSVTYYDKKVDKTTAQMKAKSYLAAHLRDFELTVEGTILSEPNIDIGDIVTLDNPKSHPNQLKSAKGGKPEFLFVKGINTNWEGESPIQTDIELQFAPTSPQKKEVPTAGTWGTTNNVSNFGDSQSTATDPNAATGLNTGTDSTTTQDGSNQDVNE